MGEGTRAQVDPTEESVVTCPVPNCHLAAGQGRLMCLQHWSAVPHKLQLQVLKSWNGYLRARTSAGRRIAMARYRPARDAAIAAVSAKVVA